MCRIFFVLPNCDSLAACRAAVRQYSPKVVMLDKTLGMQAVLEWITDLRLTFSREGNRTLPAIVVWGVSMTEAEALRFLPGRRARHSAEDGERGSAGACLEAVAQGRSWMEDSVFRNTPTPERYHRSELTPAKPR